MRARFLDALQRGRGRAHELEELLRELEVLAAAGLLPERREDDALQDVLPRHARLQVLDQVIRLHNLSAGTQWASEVLLRQ